MFAAGSFFLVSAFNFIKQKAGRQKRRLEWSKTHDFLRVKKAETLFACAETLGNPLETLLETLETPPETPQQALLETMTNPRNCTETCMPQST